MNFLLDTCAILHLAKTPERLSESARDAVLHPDNPIFVSVATTAELACLQDRRRVDLPVHWRNWFRKQVQDNGWNVLPITQEIMEEAYSLPEPIHRDPADRLLIATARQHRMPLVTTDALILEYPHVDSLR